MTPMSEIAKCRCGAECRVQNEDNPEPMSPVWVGCLNCNSSGPWELSRKEAISAWNALMRPRPVARWGAPAVVTYLYVGRAVLGYVLTGQSGSESAVCGVTGEHFRGYDARAWLVARVLGAGFDVEDVSDG